jgi:hypothetical protein
MEVTAELRPEILSHGPGSSGGVRKGTTNDDDWL